MKFIHLSHVNLNWHWHLPGCFAAFHGGGGGAGLLHIAVIFLISAVVCAVVALFGKKS